MGLYRYDGGENQMVIKTNIPLWFGAAAITIFPFILVMKNVPERSLVTLALHEGVHYAQQKRWFKYGLGVGLIAWFILYLGVLPVGWNPFRKKWETEAFLAQGYSEDQITRILHEGPYYLWR
jgi:hypothetical protein